MLQVIIATSRGRSKTRSGRVAAARQRVIGALVECPDTVAVEALFIHFEEGPHQPGTGDILHDILDGLGRRLEPAVLVAGGFRVTAARVEFGTRVVLDVQFGILLDTGSAQGLRSSG